MCSILTSYLFFSASSCASLSLMYLLNILIIYDPLPMAHNKSGHISASSHYSLDIDQFHSKITYNPLCHHNQFYTQPKNFAHSFKQYFLFSNIQESKLNTKIVRHHLIREWTGEIITTIAFHR